MEIKHIMMHSVETVAPDELLCEAACKMAAQNIGFLPVWQDGALVGVITDRDIVVRAVARGFDPEQTIVEEVMTSMVVSLPENSDIEDASDLMETKHVRRLVVTDENDMLVGIVSLDKVALFLGVYAMDDGLVRDPPAFPELVGQSLSVQDRETGPARRIGDRSATGRAARDQAESR